MTISVASSIYVAVKPLIKIYLNGALGFLLAKVNVFDVRTCQRISTLIINFLVPALIFSNVIRSLYGGLIKQIGILVLTAFMFQAIGLAGAALIWYLTPNPRNWLGGVLIAGTFSNCSDIPIAYITTLARGPFLPDSAGNQGTAYSVIFMSVFVFSLFNLGGVRLLERDFKYRPNDPNRHQVSSPLLAQWIASKFKSIRPRRNNNKSTERQEIKYHPEESATSVSGDAATNQGRFTTNISSRDCVANRLGHLSRSSVNSNLSSVSMSSIRLAETNRARDMPATPGFAVPHPSRTEHSESSRDVVAIYAHDTNSFKEKSFAQPSLKETNFSLLGDVIGWLKQFCKDLLRPQSIALAVSLTITMIPWVRRLFYLDPETNETYGITQAPDGLPILDFAIDFTSFIGGACVPLGLAMLGATIARIDARSLPRHFWQSALLMCALKLVVIPIIALLWVSKLQSLRWLDPENDQTAAFIIVVTSGVPTATSQLYITAMLTASYYRVAPANSTGGDDENEEPRVEMDCLAAYLLLQYTCLIITLTILVTYTLQNVVTLE